MIAKAAVKRLVAQLLLVAGAAGALGTLAVAGRVVLGASTGADPASALHDLPELPATAAHQVGWLPDAWRRERRLEPATRVAVAAAYVRAWAAIGRYPATGDAGPVTAYLSGPLRDAVLAAPRAEPTATWPLGHRLRLSFYARDGGTVAVRDEAATLVRAASLAGVETVTTTTERYDAVLVLEDGYWRVRQLRRLGAGTPVAVVGPAGPVTGLGPAPAARPVAALTGVGWTPAGGWPGDRDAVAADLRRARALGYDTVRVELPYAALGGDDPGPTAFAPVRRLLEQAAAAGVRVELVLFGGRADLRPGTWAGDERHLDAAVAALAGSPALALWDLGDGPDRAGPATGTEVRARLVRLAGRLRAADPDTPLTIGWRTAAAATDPALARLVDVVTLRWTGTAGDLPAALAAVTAAAGTRPVLLTGLGGHSWNGWLPGGRTENQQAAAAAAVLGAARRAGVVSTVAAALRDGPDPAAGRWPWRAGPAGAAGVLRADGSAKPVAAVLAGTGPAPRPGLLEATRLRSRRLAAGLLVVAALLAAARVRARPAGRGRSGAVPPRRSGGRRRLGRAAEDGPSPRAAGAPHDRRR